MKRKMISLVVGGADSIPGSIKDFLPTFHKNFTFHHHNIYENMNRKLVLKISVLHNLIYILRSGQGFIQFYILP